ncbi:endonuclease/exonuclease/phosphatase family protein [Leptospira sarikeiensis]|uniref:Endonuclease n=1 Tax=Leptospira sarikeiensis TaxID=2484943 RepID=A0A4R9KEW3_9LEPT|nr:endonuclease [Leptospira sarikeiensis]
MHRALLRFLGIPFAFLVTISIIAKSPIKKLKITSFNSYFLYDEIGDSYKTPKDRKHRTEEDFSKLKKIILSNHPDIIGFQEIENEEALKHIIINEYDCRATITRGYSQEVGLCWKKELGQPSIREIEELSLRPGLRKGLLAEFAFENKKISVLVVHLKAGRSPKDKKERKEQIQVLHKILPDLGKFVLLGDFNEILESRIDLWRILQGDLRLKSANYKQQSDCWQHQDGFIDYLITNLHWEEGSFKQIKFGSDDGNFDGNPIEEKGLSDHCPITADLLL